MALTNAEKQAAWRERQQHTLRGRESRIRDLEKHVAALQKEMKRLRNQGEGIHTADGKLAAKLEPLLEGLHNEGKKNMATMAPAQVAYLAGKLERLLVEHGVIPETKREAKRKASHEKQLAKMGVEVT